MCIRDRLQEQHSRVHYLSDVEKAWRQSQAEKRELWRYDPAKRALALSAMQLLHEKLGPMPELQERMGAPVAPLFRNIGQLAVNRYNRRELNTAEDLCERAARGAAFGIAQHAKDRGPSAPAAATLPIDVIARISRDVRAGSLTPQQLESAIGKWPAVFLGARPHRLPIPLEFDR
eukprot:237323-Rhodomonas_salina.1